MTYSLEELIRDLSANNVPINDEIYNYLCPTDRTRLKQLLLRLAAIRDFDHTKAAASRRLANANPASKRKHKHFTVKSLQAIRSRITGKTLENIINLLAANCKPITSTANLRTSTAEIDILIRLGPVASLVPMLKSAGTHIIGEAKCYASGFKQEWVNELQGLMQQHSCSHSILFVGCPSKTLKIEHRHGLHIHATKGSRIVPFGMKQLSEVASGANFLTVLEKQCVDVQIGAVTLAI